MVDRTLAGRTAQQAGKDFELLLKNSWAKVPLSWRIRIDDGRGCERPADELVLLSTFRLLVEAKSTSAKSFSVSKNVKPHQITAAHEFESVSCKNVGLLFIEFRALNRVIMINTCSLINYLKQINKASIKPDDLREVKHTEIKMQNGFLILDNVEEIIKTWI